MDRKPVKMIRKEGVMLSLAVLMWLIFRTDGIVVEKEYKLHPFQCEPPADCDSILSLHQHPTGNLFVATRKSIKKVDEVLSEKLDRKTDEEGSGGMNVLLALRDTDFILCKNGPNGICELREAEHLDLVEGVDRRPFVVPPGGQSPPIGWIDQGPLDGEDALNMALTSGETGGIIPLLSTRRLPKDNLSRIPEFLDYLVDDYFVPASYLKSGPCLEVKIEPFYGFSVGSYKYLLKRHSTAQKGEYTGVRIAQLCRGDVSYRSYIELPLECGNDASGGDGQSQVLVNSAAHLVDDYLYVSFTRSTGTDVCNYGITWINARFRERRRECLEARTETTELSWFGYNRCPSKLLPPSKFDYSRLDEDDFCYDLEVAQPLGGTKPIWKAPMAFLTRPEVITSILVVKSEEKRGTTTYILGDTKGYVHAIDENGSHKSKTIDVGHKILPVGGLILHPGGEQFYASSPRKIVLMSLATQPTTTAPPTTRTPVIGRGTKSTAVVHTVLTSLIVGYIISWTVCR